MLRVPLNMGKSAAYCQGNVREFCSVWRVVTLKYTSLTNKYYFSQSQSNPTVRSVKVPLSFLATLGERLTGTSGDLREMSYLFQRLSVIVQRFNSVLIHECFVSADEEPDL